MEHMDIGSVYKQNRMLYLATIELCKTCNWNCKYCYQDDHLDVGLPYDKIVDVLKQLRQLGCYEVSFTGGELFTRKDAMDLIKIARKMGFAVSLMTNLSLLNRATLDTLKSINIESIECSIFSLNPIVHDDFVESQGAFSKVYDNIFYCKKIGIDVNIGFHPLTINYTELKHFVDFVETYGLKAKYDGVVLPRLDGNMSVMDYALSGDELIECFKITDKQMGVEYKRKYDDYVCDRTHISIYITTKGDVKLCNLLDIVVGNVIVDPLKTIMDTSKNGEKLSYIRDVKWSDLSNECIECPDNQFCVRCPGIALLENKGYLESSPINCNIAKARRLAAFG